MKTPEYAMLNGVITHMYEDARNDLPTCDFISDAAYRAMHLPPLTSEELTALLAFYHYGATRGNHGEDGAFSGPLSPHITLMAELVRRFVVDGRVRENIQRTKEAQP